MLHRHLREAVITPCRVKMNSYPLVVKLCQITNERAYPLDFELQNIEARANNPEIRQNQQFNSIRRDDVVNVNFSNYNRLTSQLESLISQQNVDSQDVEDNKKTSCFF